MDEERVSLLEGATVTSSLVALKRRRASLIRQSPKSLLEIAFQIKAIMGTNVLHVVLQVANRLKVKRDITRILCQHDGFTRECVGQSDFIENIRIAAS